MMMRIANPISTMPATAAAMMMMCRGILVGVVDIASVWGPVFVSLGRTLSALRKLLQGPFSLTRGLL